MAEQSDNEFKELPKEVQERIERDITNKFNKLAHPTKDESIINMMIAFKEAYIDLLRSSAIEEWKYKEIALKSQAELVEAYDAQIKELNEVIQKKVERLNP